MTKMVTLKAEQEAQEIEQLTRVVQAELEALYERLDATRRVFRLGDDESASILLGCFDQFVAGLAVDAGSTREEFLRSMGESFDDMKEDEEPEEPSEGDETEQETGADA